MLKGIVELKKEGLYAGALIKKQRYWPSLVPGKEIDAHFDNKQVGKTDSNSIKLDNIEYFIWGMIEPDNKMTIMGTDGALVKNGCKEVCRKWKDGSKNHATKFAYTKPFHWHFHYHHILNDHNNLCHALPSIEET